MKKKLHAVLLCSALVLVMILTASSGVTGAYFTTYTMAKGGATVHAGAEIDVPKEEVNPMELTKDISLTNIGTHDCWARVRIIWPEGYDVSDIYLSRRWEHTEGDEYWYYTSILEPGESTPEHSLKVKIKVPYGAQEDFNVVVIEECVPVLNYTNPEYTDAIWDGLRPAKVE